MVLENAIWSWNLHLFYLVFSFGCRDPKLRPTFAEIMAALKPLQKPITSSQVLRPGMSVSNAREKGQPSRLAEEETG